MKFIAGNPVICIETLSGEYKQILYTVISYDYDKISRTMIIGTSNVLSGMYRSDNYIIHIDFSVYDSTKNDERVGGFTNHYVGKYIRSFVEKANAEEPFNYYTEFRIL